jgi:hypothetical protein
MEATTRTDDPRRMDHPEYRPEAHARTLWGALLLTAFTAVAWTAGLALAGCGVVMAATVGVIAGASAFVAAAIMGARRQ